MSRGQLQGMFPICTGDVFSGQAQHVSFIIFVSLIKFQQHRKFCCKSCNLFELGGSGLCSHVPTETSAAYGWVLLL